jgi:hypothetical protein
MTTQVLYFNIWSILLHLVVTEFMIPPDPFSGFCPCFKPVRAGDEYDSSVRRTTTKLINSTFMMQCALIETQAEEINAESSKYSDYITRMVAIHDSLDGIVTKGDAGARESARAKLQSAAEETDRFIKIYFESEAADFKAEAVRRIKLATDALSTRNLPRKALMNSQASLQEIMNSCAVESEKKAKKSLRSLDDLVESLRLAKTKESDYYSSLTGASNEMLDLTNEHQNEAELYTIDLEKKLGDATTRWRVVKKKSVCRAVVSFEDETALPQPLQTMSSPGDLLNDPSRALKQTSKSIEKIGKSITSAPLKGLDMMADGVANIATSGVSGVANIASSGASKAVDFAGKGVEGVGRFATGGAKMAVQAGRDLVGAEKPSKPPVKPSKKK